MALEALEAEASSSLSTAPAIEGLGRMVVHPAVCCEPVLLTVLVAALAGCGGGTT